MNCPELENINLKQKQIMLAVDILFTRIIKTDIQGH